MDITFRIIKVPDKKLKYSCRENTMQCIGKLSYIVIIGIMKGKPAICLTIEAVKCNL